MIKNDDELGPVAPESVEVAHGSTDRITVSIDDSAPDQTSVKGYLATYDITRGSSRGCTTSPTGSSTAFSTTSRS